MPQISGLHPAAPNGYTDQLNFDDLMMINQGFVPGSSDPNDSGIEKRLSLGMLRKKFFGEGSFVIDTLHNSLQLTTQSNFIPLYYFLSERYRADVVGKYSLKPFSIQFLVKIFTSYNYYSYIGSLDFLGYADTTSTMPSASTIAEHCQVAIYNAPSQYLPTGLEFRICVTDGNQVRIGISWSATANGEPYSLNMLALCNGIDCDKEDEIVTNNNDGWTTLYGRTIGSANNPVYWSSKGLQACANSIQVTSQLPADPDASTFYFVP